MSDTAVADVRRGDLLLVTHRKGDALADLILAFDRSPGDFSHSGIALGDGAILSAIPGYEGLIPPDFGGLRSECFEHFWDLYDQDIHRVAVTDAQRAAACDRLDGYLPPTADFSIPKIVMVAAALHALAPDNAIEDEGRDRVVRSAIAAARAWENDPEYYCAEFAARVYDWRFTLRELVPPARYLLVRRPFERVGVEVARRLLSAGRDDRQKAALHAFLDEVWHSDPGFFDVGLAAAIRAGLDGASAAVREAVAERRDRRHLVAETLDPDLELPRALVSPRMLAVRGAGESALVTRSTTPCHERAAADAEASRA